MPLATRMAIACFAALLSFAAWYFVNRPVETDQTWLENPAKSVSFAPFRRGESPLSGPHPSQAEIEEDLAILSGRTRAVRTYTAREGLDAVVRLAERYRLSVAQGIWLDADRAANEREIAAVIDLANRHPQTISRVIVGSEVLLRRELTADEVAGYIRRVRQAVRQPVTYADVPDFWLKNAQLAREVDFITAHFLPYWDDNPVGIDRAAEWVMATYERLQRAFPGKPIFIGEAGWPSTGRSRAAAVPGRAAQAQFFADFLRVATEHNYDYNLFEAFDQPWKSANEGRVGANWGIFDAQRAPKFQPNEPIAENPHWYVAFAGAGALGAALTLWLLGTGVGAAPGFAVALLAQALAAMLAVSAQHGVAVWHDKGIYAAPVAQFVLQAMLAWLLLAEAARRLASRPAPVAMLSSLSALTRIGNVPWRDRLIILFALLAAYETILLWARPDLPAMTQPLEMLPDRGKYWVSVIFNGRYRDFPIAEFLVPTVGFAAALAVLAAFGRPARVMPSMGPKLDAAFAALMLASVALLQAVEHFANREAAAWGLMAGVLALPSAAAIVARGAARQSAREHLMPSRHGPRSSL